MGDFFFVPDHGGVTRTICSHALSGTLTLGLTGSGEMVSQPRPETAHLEHRAGFIFPRRSSCTTNR